MVFTGVEKVSLTFANFYRKPNKYIVIFLPPAFDYIESVVCSRKTENVKLYFCISIRKIDCFINHFVIVLLKLCIYIKFTKSMGINGDKWKKK